MLSQILVISHFSFAAMLIIFILLQKGDGGAMGALAGASESMFGSRQSRSLMTRLTAIMASLFFFTCIALGFFYAPSGESYLAKLSQMDSQEKPLQSTLETTIKDLNTSSELAGVPTV